MQPDPRIVVLVKVATAIAHRRKQRKPRIAPMPKEKAA